jgi:hypothetical protein
METIKARKA